jgi:hypothetical protein
MPAGTYVAVQKLFQKIKSITPEFPELTYQVHKEQLINALTLWSLLEPLRTQWLKRLIRQPLFIHSLPSVHACL